MKNDHLNKPYEETLNWLKNIVIKLNLCPFAKDPFEKGDIFIEQVDTSMIETKLIEHFSLIQKNLAQTSIIILPQITDYLELLDLIDFLNPIHNSDNHFQLVPFHPHFVFQDYDYDDIANFVNRSPHPIIHILKSSDLNDLLDEKQAKDLSSKNEKLLKKLSSSELFEIFYYLKKPKH